MALNTSGLRTSRLRLQRPRPAESLAIDTEHVDADGASLVPFMPWAEFFNWFDWRQGEHIALAGKSKSGKTTLARQLLPRRDFVVVMATKKRDDSLYEPLIEMGYEVQDHFDPYDREHPKVIFKPGSARSRP